MQPTPDCPDLKPGNGPRSILRHADASRAPLTLLYLHGFTASPGEAGALPERMAEALDANLYVHRWPGHGIAAPDAMQGLTLAALQASAIEALATAQGMGERVAIVGSSLGGSLGLWLASVRPEAVAAVVAWSPGVQAADPALLDRFCAEEQPLTDPRPRTPASLAFWSVSVHPDGYRALRDLFRSLEAAPPWPRVKCPVFLGYYRGPDGDEDQTASVPAMLGMFDALGTPPSRKLAVAFPAGAHVIGSPHKSALAERVAGASIEFLREHAGAIVSGEHGIREQQEVRDV